MYQHEPSSDARNSQARPTLDIELRAFYGGDRPEGGKWGYGDTSEKDDDDLLDNVTVYGRYTCSRINWDGEEEVPTIGLNVWTYFCCGVERFFSRLKGPVFD